MDFALDSRTWAEQEFSDCSLGDKRRSKRLIQVADRVANNPSASIPQQMETWGDIKGAYRLFDADGVTFQSLVGPHWERTKQCEPGRYLILDDTTEMNFGYKRDIDGLAPLGNGNGRGFLLHNGLLVNAETKAIKGVAGQAIHYRKRAPKKESHAQRFKRERESRVWGDVINQIGAPQEGVEFVHVCDRGADDFEVFCHLIQNRCHWVVRTSSKHRHILTPDDKKIPLSGYLPSMQLAGTYELQLRARPDAPARTAQIEVRFGRILMPMPRQASSYVKKLKPAPIEMWVVDVHEVGAPTGTKPIEWCLYTSLPVTSFDDAWAVIEYYETRWLVEEYHKALKTGCGATKRLLRSSKRLEALIGLTSVIAVRLLQLKSVARSDPHRLAKSTVPPLWLAMLKAVRKNLHRVHDLTIYQFYRELAKLGGFIGRKSDGEPGWITIWRGWEKLNDLVRGAEVAFKLKKCG
jgi:hypothetical protein